jgi:UDP-N-acetylglucosamine acyltransferase
MLIHPTSIIHESARVAPTATIGPFCVVGADVEIGDSTELISHVNIQGPTKIGARNRIFPFCAIGFEPQDYTFKGQHVTLEIADDNIIRESVTISRGTEKGGGITRIGSHCFLMAYAHIGHDCQIADHCMLVNNATLAGHVIMEPWSVLGAFSAVHQFCRVGAHAYIGGGTICTQDVLPFAKTSARRDATTFGINAIGLERRGFSKERVTALQRAYKLIKRNNVTQALVELKQDAAPTEDVALLIKFLEQSERGVIR